MKKPGFLTLLCIVMSLAAVLVWVFVAYPTVVELGRLQPIPIWIDGQEGGPPDIIFPAWPNPERVKASALNGLDTIYHWPYREDEPVVWFYENFPYYVRGETFYYSAYYFILVPEEYWEGLRSGRDFSKMVPWTPKPHYGGFYGQED